MALSVLSWNGLRFDAPLENLDHDAHFIVVDLTGFQSLDFPPQLGELFPAKVLLDSFGCCHVGGWNLEQVDSPDLRRVILDIHPRFILAFCDDFPSVESGDVAHFVKALVGDRARSAAEVHQRDELALMIGGIPEPCRVAATVFPV
jgi:hypothetical protein